MLEAKAVTVGASLDGTPRLDQAANDADQRILEAERMCKEMNEQRTARRGPRGKARTAAIHTSAAIGENPLPKADRVFCAALRSRRDRSAASAASAAVTAVAPAAAAPLTSAPVASPFVSDLSEMVYEAWVENPVGLQAQFAEFRMLRTCLPGSSAEKWFHASHRAGLPPAVETGASRGAGRRQLGRGGGAPQLQWWV